MEIKLDFETYLFLSPQKIAISVYDKPNLKKLYYKEVININEKKDFKFEIVDDFLEKNIFEIEKKLKNFIEHINLIVESIEFLTIQISVKKNNYGKKISKDNLIYLLNEAKDECKETISDRRITHMLIDNYFIDKKNYSFLPIDQKCDFLSLDIRFVCLSKNYIRDIEKILKKYQISINNILQTDYIRSFQKENQNDLFLIAMKIIEGYNKNEVLIVPKESKNKGFFERFFNFFN